jgi:hypothetical protein
MSNEQKPVAWMSPSRERLEFSRADTVYGSHTIPLYTHPTPAVVKQLVEALEQLMSIVTIHSRATSNNFAWAEMDEAKEALAAARKRYYE